MNVNTVEQRFALLLCLCLLVGAVLAACGSNNETATEPTAAVAESPAAASPVPEEEATMPPASEEPGGDGSVAETLASNGEQVYAAECAECHGEQGEGLIGPALLGDGANLSAYGTAQGLYDYVHLSMPQDAPGSLTDEQYLEVVTHILLENAAIEPDTDMSVEGLSNIPLQ